MKAFLRTAFAILFAVSLTAGARDTFTRDELDQLEAARASAEAELKRLKSQGESVHTDAENLEADLLAAAAESRRRETDATKAEASLEEIAAEQKQIRAELLENEQAFEDLMAALAASNRRRPPALIVSPGRANDAIRRAILMSATSPRLTERADGLKAQIQKLTELERATRAEKLRLATAEAQLAVKRLEIERLATSKRQSAKVIGSDIDRLTARAKTLSEAAGDLRELLSALEALAPSAPSLKPARPTRIAATAQPVRPPVSAPRPAQPPRPAPVPLPRSASTGALAVPVAGDVRYGFGDKLPAGGVSEWITYQTRAEAQVVAPAEGRVEYARPFRSYGSMLILRTNRDYRVILTGMSRIYVTEGQTVSAGEPVGQMPNRTDPLPELNMELRLGDEVINPADWNGSSD